MHHMGLWVMAAGRSHNSDVCRWLSCEPSDFCNELWKSKITHVYLFPQANFTLDGINKSHDHNPFVQDRWCRENSSGYI